LVEKVETRRGVIIRGYRNRQHIIAANVDQVLIVSALAEPGLKLGLVDRYLVSAETGGVRPVVVFNKADLVEMATYQWVVGLYAQLGYETVSPPWPMAGASIGSGPCWRAVSRPSQARAASAKARS
jgi:ribosome biogenesis GTPase